jgi:hypothetical protein
MIAVWIIVIIGVVFEIPHTIERLHSIRRGLKALIFLPVVWTVAIVSIVSSVYLSNVFPILKWGWLGYNLITVPISESVAERTADPTIVLSPTSSILFLVIFFIIIYACLMYNYYEEEMFRDSLLSVVIWALIHTLMGIPIYAVIPIFFMGLIYKYVYDRYSIDHSYCLHFFTNCSLILVLMVAFFMM